MDVEDIYSEGRDPQAYPQQNGPHYYEGHLSLSDVATESPITWSREPSGPRPEERYSEDALFKQWSVWSGSWRLSGMLVILMVNFSLIVSHLYQLYFVFYRISQSMHMNLEASYVSFAYTAIIDTGVA